MPIKKKVVKKTTTRKKAVAKKPKPRVGGIASYVKRLFAAPAVKRAAATVKSLELKLKAAKKVKAAAVKTARKKI
jgi:hypothetical protein